MAEDERRGERSGTRRREVRPQRTTPPVIGLEPGVPAGEATEPEVGSVAPIVEPVSPAQVATVDPVEPVQQIEPVPQTEPVRQAETVPQAETVSRAETGLEREPAVTEATEPVAIETPDAAVEQPSVQSAAEPFRTENVASTREPKRPSIVPAAAALVVAILAAGWIYLYNQVSAVQTDDRAQIASLQAKLGELEAPPVADTAALTKQIDSAAAQSRDTLTALSRRVDGLQSAAGADPKQIEGVQKDLDSVKASVGALSDKVAALPKPDLARIDGKIGDLGQKLTQLQAAVGAIPHIDLGPLTSKVDTLGSRLDGAESRLKPLEAEAEAARSPQRVAERRAAPVAVTAQAIVEAIAAGQAFPHEFAALQALGADPVKLAPLQVVAGAGAPSLGELQSSLADLRDSIVARGAPKATGSYFDRIVAGAGSLVQVRPLGSVVGDTPAAIVARMNASIGADDLAHALHDWEQLPEPSRDVSKALADRLRVRLEAEEAAKGIAANAIGAMAATRG